MLGPCVLSLATRRRNMAGLRSSLAALVAIACLWNVRSLRAHEGHEPLPTKGAQVDVGKGLITLSPEAQQIGRAHV